MKIVELKQAHAKQNQKIVDSLEHLLELARAGEMVSMVILFDGTGDAEYGFAELGEWDEARAVFHAEQWKAAVLSNKVKDVR